MAENNIFFPDSGIESLPGVSTTKSLHMIFVVDNSGSMRHKDSSGMDRMTAVNTAFDRMLQSLQDLQAGVQDAYTIYISIMFFNEDPEWHVQVAPIATYFHQEIPVSPYVTYYSRAYQELNSKLSRSAFMNQKGKMAAPYIMLMTDGAPTEGDNYEAALDELKTNGWFDVAQRYAVLIGEDTVNDANARHAVEGFVTDPKEGIINAVDAQKIVETVSAKTIHIVEQMTHRANPADGGEIPMGGGGGIPPWGDFGLGGSGEDPGLGSGVWDNLDNTPLIDPNLVF